MIEIFNKFKLKHSDPAIRLEAVKTLQKNAPEFFEVAREDTDENVRAEATAGVTNPEQLEQLLKKETSERILKYLYRKLDRIYLHQLEKCRDSTEAQAIAAKISDDQEHLAAAASHAVDYDAALACSKRVTDSKAKIKIFRNSQSRQLCDELLQEINDLKMLEKIAHSAAIVTVRHDAEERIKELVPPEPPVEEEAPQEDSPYQKEMNLRHKLTEAMEKALKNIASMTVEGFDKLIQQWDKLPMPADGMAELLERRFKEATSLCRDEMDKVRKKAKKLAHGKSQLEALCKDVEELVFSAKNRRHVQEKIENIKHNWTKMTTGLTDITKLNKRFTEKVTALETQVADYHEQVKVARETIKESCQQLEKMVEDHTPEVVKEQVREIRNKAKDAQEFLLNAKALPRRLADRLQRAEKQFRGQLYQEYQARDFGRWEHYTLKLDICKKMEEMQGSDNFKKIGKKLSEFRRKWYELGAVPQEKAKEIQTRFDELYKTLRGRCDEFFVKYRELQTVSAEVKQSLCEKAEGMQHSEEWNSAADTFKELQRLWKENVPAPRDIEQELYKRFRGACDTFFNRRKAHYGELKKFRSSVISEKSKICEQAEELAENGTSEDLNTTRRLRREWRDAGRAGKADASLNERFNGALDKFFNRLNESRTENLTKRQAICDQLKELLEGKLNAKSGIKFREINSQWRELPMVPGNDAIKIEKQYSKWTDAFHHQMEGVEFKLYLKAVKELQKFEKGLSELDGPVPDDFCDLEKLPKSAIKPAGKYIEKLKADPQSEKLQKKLALNLEKRREACLAIEKLAGLVEPETPVSLAEELQAAILGNSLAPMVDKSDPVKDFKRLRKAWDAQTPAEYSEAGDAPKLYKRYSAACKAIIKQSEQEDKV
jgi:Domain of Unknown Function (DUF349)